MADWVTLDFAIEMSNDAAFSVSPFRYETADAGQWRALVAVRDGEVLTPSDIALAKIPLQTHEVGVRDVVIRHTCQACGAHADATGGHKDLLPHVDGCAWERARAIVGDADE